MTALEQLEWAVRALAQRFATQMQLYPAFVVVSDELALEFEHGITLLSEADGASSLTTEQKDALDELDAKITSMSGQGANARFWTNESLEHDREWSDVRKLAVNLIRLMAWSDASPGPCVGIYVSSNA